MNFAEPVSALTALCLSALCLAGAASDLWSRRLPNWLCAAAWVAGLGFVVADGGTAAAVSPFIHSILALIGGMVLFRFGMIGGGDAKYYAALAAWFALDRAILLLLCVALAGAVLVVMMLLVGTIRRQNRNDRRRTMSELPYGVAIAGGAAVTWFLGAA